MAHLTDSIHLARHGHVLQWIESVSFGVAFFTAFRYYCCFFVTGISFIMPPSLWKSYDLDFVGFGYALLWR